MTEQTSIQLLIAIVGVIFVILVAIAAFSYRAMRTRSRARSVPWTEIMDDQFKRAGMLRDEIEEACQTNLRLGRQTHGFYLALGVLIVGSSALSAILALGFEEVDRRFIGAIALIPGICAGVADRFHLVLKKHWYYRKYDRLKALSRRMNFILPPKVTEAEITKVAIDLCRIDRDMSKAWELLEEENPTPKPESKRMT